MSTPRFLGSWRIVRGRATVLLAFRGAWVTGGRAWKFPSRSQNGNFPRPWKFPLCSCCNVLIDTPPSCTGTHAAVQIPAG